ncbi:2TM domain-containing protein [Lutibacter sp.]|uniref:2TM domain-containing protein n=1 Tax=Lutibacter sp. TaxID=1925666 RepID=UPI0035655FD2
MNAMNEQHELYENARNRTKQKKRLYNHFIIFLVGSVFLILLNKVLNVGESFVENWFVWAITLWFFFFVLHFINVFVTHKFMGKEWERIETEKLVQKQELKIAKLEKDMASKAAIKNENTPSSSELNTTEDTQKII